MTIYGSRTVHEGSRVAIWSRSGKVKIVDGPARVTLVFQRCVPLRQYRADQSQYLAVRKRAGPIEIKPGPCTVFFDPVEDEGISVENAVQIDASQARMMWRARRWLLHWVMRNCALHAVPLRMNTLLASDNQR